jgi:predicted alpha/beta hydrolase family esterase
MTHVVTPIASEPQHVPIRILVVPGLHDSGPGHWQTWLQGQYRGAVRVVQSDWHRPDLSAWSERIAQTLARHDPRTEWVAVAHSFGCLALAHHLGLHNAMSKGPLTAGLAHIRAALMVAPADPDKFGVTHHLPTQGLGLPATLVGSNTDPWMRADQAQAWAARWGVNFHNLGDAGHINVESGFGPWPLARYKVDQMVRHLQQQRRLARAHPMEFSYAI